MTQAKAKSNSVVTTQWSGCILTINVLGAQMVGGKPTDAALMFDMEKASIANREAAERHGWTQRLCDRAAKGRDPKTGQSASAALKYAAIEELINYYEGGDVPWKMSGGGSGDGGMLLTALCRLRPNLTVDQVATFLETRTPEQLKAVKLRKDVVEQMNQIRLERAGAVDNDDAFAELDALGTDETETDVDGEIAELIAKE
jgi:hypothetical protein